MSDLTAIALLALCGLAFIVWGLIDSATMSRCEEHYSRSTCVHIIR